MSPPSRGPLPDLKNEKYCHFGALSYQQAVEFFKIKFGDQGCKYKFWKSTFSVEI